MFFLTALTIESSGLGYTPRWPDFADFLSTASRTKKDGIEYTSVAYLTYHRARIRGHGKIPQDDCADFPAIKPLRS